MMGNVLAEDCNRLCARLYWSFNSLNVLFSCLDAKDSGYKPLCRVLSTNTPNGEKNILIYVVRNVTPTRRLPPVLTMDQFDYAIKR